MTAVLRQWGIWVGLVMLTGCQPTLTEGDREFLESQRTPRTRVTEYSTALKRLGRIINKGGGGTARTFQVKPITNQSGGEGIPFNVTEMVITSIQNLSGNALYVVPHYFDYESQDAVLNTGTQVRKRRKPDIVIAGAITEFDQDISVEDSAFDINLFGPLSIEGEDLDPEIEYAFDHAKSISRIALDLRLMNYDSTVFYPGKQVSNTIVVAEVERGSSLGFMIYGSGISRSGRIAVRQGLHQAVRNLIDYSMLQLMGIQYTIPFWKTLDNRHDSLGQEYLAEWRQEFLNIDEPMKVGRIQAWLLNYDLGPVYVDGTLYQEIPKSEYGKFQRITQAFALKYLYEYAPHSSLISDIEQSNTFLSADMLVTLYMMLIETLPL